MAVDAHPDDPEPSCRTFLTGMVEAAAERFGGRPAVTFEVSTHQDRPQGTPLRKPSAESAG
ncbi:hypothetical protein OHA63_36435 [Streptomyces anulatus]|uniref:hypothetical protein n=1 Tax=Streptomyces anulatus TaxID=1892 RepID=UPI002E309CB6|nr:hypothetical protein [Streptomyces anulatus]